MKRATRYEAEHGFALPTVMITSVVMLTILLTGLVTVSSINVGIRNQYYAQLTKEAAESGLNFITGCLRADFEPPTGATFTPQATSCLNNTIDAGKSKYILDTTSSAGTKLRSWYEVSGPSISITGYYDIVAVGHLELLRTSSSTVVQTLERTVRLRASPGYFRPDGLVVRATGRTPYVILGDGTLWAWGNNNVGQVGNGTTGGLINAPTKVLDIATRSVVADGANETAWAITTSGNLYAWGANTYGQLGDGTTTARSSPTLLSLGSSGGVIDVKSNYLTTYALKDDGSVWAWGSNTYGQIGDGTTTNNPTPQQVVAPSATNPVVKIIEIRDFVAGVMYAIRQDGSLLAWGRNHRGQVGNNLPTTQNQLTPVQVISSTTPVSDVVTSYSDSVAVTALLSNGTLMRWGYAASGAGTGNTLVPTAVAGLTNIAKIVGTGRGTTYALSSSGTLWSWGYNTYGEMGNGLTTFTITPYNVFPSGPAITDVTMSKNISSNVTVALGANGSVWTWGQNGQCQIGDGDVSKAVNPRLSPYNAIPAPSGGQPGADEIYTNDASGYWISSTYPTVYVHKTDDTVWAWGSNNSGAVGNGSTVDQCSPVQVLDNVAFGSNANYYAFFAVRGDRTLWTWGNNGYYQLGRTGGGYTSPGLTTLPSTSPLAY